MTTATKHKSRSKRTKNARIYKLRYHQVQQQMYSSGVRFIISHSGRRSGKTEIAKRKLVRAALSCTLEDGFFIAAAPTRAQAKHIFWKDLKKMVPRKLLACKPSETELLITLKTGVCVQVVGMEKPERAEGIPLDGIVLDEYANMKADVWTEHIRPALTTTGREPGWAIFIGVPEGRNHFFGLVNTAKRADAKNWRVYKWPSSDIIPEEAEEAKNDLDALTWAQEFLGEFVQFEGRAYHAFDTDVHAIGRTFYDPEKALIFCLDFNRRPGIAVVCQEGKPPPWLQRASETVTHVINEVYITRNSTTEKVCEKLIEMYSGHNGTVRVYGDATGGAKTSQGVAGSDWDIVVNKLRPVFGENLEQYWPDSNPPVRSRLNAMNSRMMSTTGVVRLCIDSSCINTILDLEGVECDDKGDIEKQKDSMLTHLSDGLGYYVVERFPTSSGSDWEVRPIYEDAA